MVNVTVFVVLACALLCLPGPAAPARLRELVDGSARPSAHLRLRRRAPLLAVLACGVAGVIVLGPVGGLCAAAGADGVRRSRRRSAAARRSAETSRELADALARITDELRTGAHPATALAGTDHDGPLARDLLAPAEAAARLGEPVPAALRRSAAGRGAAAPELERIAAAWELADRCGAPLADLLTHALDDVRVRLAHASRVRAQLAGPRSTAAVLTALPLAGIGLGQLMGTDPVSVLRDGLLGQSLLLAGCGLTAAGTLWSGHILRTAVGS